MKNSILLVPVVCCLCLTSAPAAEPIVIDLWQGEIPGPAAQTNGPEKDLTKPTDRLIAGRRIIKLANVSKPQAHVYLPKESKANGGAFVICPGGGFSILAWDLEGTEVADWLNGLGFAAIVLKYRVPTRQHGESDKWKGPVIDAQRSLSITRSNAAKWNLDPEKIGILGFSAGGATAAFAAIKNGARLYEPNEETDKASCAANFSILIYPAYLVEKDGTLKSEISVDKKTPPTFFAHAADDPVTCLSSVALFTALKKAGVSAEVHIYATGGHGYGLRPTAMPVTHWPRRAEAWLRVMKLIDSKDE
ncbi:MAG: xylanase [Planctomycetaceae bacterium]|nr:xylanase [Planctomycetaceae bacterium]